MEPFDFCPDCGKKIGMIGPRPSLRVCPGCKSVRLARRREKDVLALQVGCPPIPHELESDGTLGVPMSVYLAQNPRPCGRRVLRSEKSLQ